MRQIVIDALSGRFPERIPSKESLNHPAFVGEVSGLDVWKDTARALELAWERLSIDIHVAAPESPAQPPRVPGGTWTEGNTKYSDLGIFPTKMPVEHLPGLPKADDDWIYQYNPRCNDFDAAAKRNELKSLSQKFRGRFGEKAVLYHLYYTTLFMWPVVTFDWEPFLLAAQDDPGRFDKHFLEPWMQVSRKHVECLCAMDEEVLFTHDDLVSGTGPMFRPEWYETHLFPRYEWIWEPIRKAGKKLVFVCDGNLDVFLERLLDFPIDGLMFENPATSFTKVCDTWGRAGRGFIGGSSTPLLTTGTPEQVAQHTREVIEQGRRHPGFMISSCGGLHGSIPLENMKAYFRTRAQSGIPASGF